MFKLLPIDPASINAMEQICVWFLFLHSTISLQNSRKGLGNHKKRRSYSVSGIRDVKLRKSESSLHQHLLPRGAM